MYFSQIVVIIKRELLLREFYIKIQKVRNKSSGLSYLNWECGLGLGICKYKLGRACS